MISVFTRKMIFWKSSLERNIWQDLLTIGIIYYLSSMEIRDGFIWKIINYDNAFVLLHLNIFNLFILHNDGSISLISESDDISSAIRNGLQIGIEVGKISSDKVFSVKEIKDKLLRLNPKIEENSKYTNPFLYHDIKAWYNELIKLEIHK